MTDEELRDLVRASIARLGRQGGNSPPAVGITDHPSLVRLPLLRSGDGDGRCLIEPAVLCNHCGYCLSYGH